MIDHLQRLALHNEVHARPPEPMQAPQVISRVVMWVDRASAQASRDHLAQLLHDHHLPAPDAQTNHVRMDLGSFRMRWELHTEFVSWTFMRPVSSDVFAQSEPMTAVQAVPQKWLAQLPGECLARLHVWLVPSSTLDIHTDMPKVLHEDTLVASTVAEGHGEVYTDFQLHPDGYSRIVLLTGSLTPRRQGRLVQQLLEQAHAEEVFAGTMSFAAVILVSYMIMWMRKASSSMSSELTGKLATALVAGAGTVIFTAFAAVAREGIETTFFFYAAVQAAGQTTGPIIGFALGIALAIALGYLLYRRAVKINLKRFFAVTGYFLIVVAAGVLSYGIHEFQEIGWLPGDSSLAFDVNSVINEEGWLGAIAAGLFNFDPDTTWLQLVAWMIYVGVMLLAFTREVKSNTKVALDLKRR